MSHLARVHLSVLACQILTPTIHPRRGATSTGDVRSPSWFSRYSRKNSDSDKDTHGLSGIPESPRLVGEKGFPPSPQLHPSRAPGSMLSPENGNSTIRSRVRPPSRSKPPEISLPQPSVYNTLPAEKPPSLIQQSPNAEHTTPKARPSRLLRNPYKAGWS